MRYKILFIILIQIINLAFLTSCGEKAIHPETESNEEESALEFVGHMLETNGIPEEGTKVSYVKPYEMVLSDYPRIVCNYHSITEIEVLESDPMLTTLTGKVKRVPGRADGATDTYNDFRCPDFDVEVDEPTPIPTMTLVEKIKADIDQHLNPEKWCEAQTDCIDYLLISRIDAIYKGIFARFVEAEFYLKNDVTLIRKSWISKEQIMLNIFEFELIDKKNNTTIDFKKTL